MAITKNAGSLFLQAANPRLLNSPSAAILLTASAPLFHVAVSGTPQVTAIVINAKLLQLEGTLSYSCVGGTLSSTVGNTTVLMYSDMTAPIATITATLSYRGSVFTSSISITKVLDSSGAAGLSNAVVYAYKRSSSTPTDNPGAIVYDFTTAAITTMTLANGWNKSIPTGTDPLFVVAASASNSTPTDNIAAAEWSSPVPLTQNGTNGLSAATVFIYKRTSTAIPPALPTASTTYTFATSQLTGLDNGWTTSVPSGSGGFLWISTATAVSSSAIDTLLSSEWAVPNVLAQNGQDGAAGIKNAVVYAFQRSDNAPAASPGDIIYDFTSAAITFPTNLAGGWLRSIPSGASPLYVTTASASNSTATDAIASGEWSSAVVLAQNGTQGLSVATIYIYRRTATNVAPVLPGASAVFTFATGVLTGLTNGWTTTVPDSSGGGFLWVSTATASNTTSTDTILSSEWAAAQILSQDGTGVGTPGTNGNSVATVTLYQWSTVVPANPTGNATFTWSSASTTGYSANDGWRTAALANPGGPGVKLFLASVPITAPYGTTSSTATFGSAQIVALSQNGAAGDQGIPGLKTATVSTYQWSLSAPTASGSATYNWFAGTYNTPPSTGWTAVKGNAPGAGYTLYEASVRLVDSTGASIGTIDWTTSSIAGIAYQGSGGGAGSQGASAKRAYVLVDGNTLALSPTTFTAAGQALPTTGTWGETRAWQATSPTPAAGQTVFQADGIFDPVPNQTVWNVPYLSQLKVGSLSAITANMGALTAGSIDLGSGALSWHVDSSGNTWAGATTYASAPFKVSNTGNAVMKSISLQTIGGDTILDPTGLKAGFEAPGTKNADIKLGGRNFLLNSQSGGDAPNGAGSGTGVLRNDEAVPYVRITSTIGFISTFKGPTVFPKIPVGTPIVVSSDVRVPVAGNVNHRSDGIDPTYVPANVWIRISNRYIYDGNSYIMGHYYEGAQQIDYRNYKVEIGNIATDWSPAPEDVDAATALAATMATGVTLSPTGVLSGGGTSGQMTTIATVDISSERATNRPPSFYSVGTKREFKDASYLSVPGISAVNSWGTLETIIQYGDSSGGSVYQYLYIGTVTWRRIGGAGASGWAGAWVQDLDRNSYTGDLNASSDIQLRVRGVGMILNGNTASRPTGGGAWDADCYSVDSFAGGAFCSFVPVMGAYYMAGLNSDPLANMSYETIDYAFYSPGTNALISYENGNGTDLGTYADGDTLAIVCDNVKVHWLKNGVSLRNVPVQSVGAKLSFDSSFVNGTVKNIRIGAMSSNDWGAVGGTGKPADNATVNIVTSSTTPPASPNNGDIWVDTNVPTTIRTRINGLWIAGGNVPTSLAHVNGTEATKLGGIAAGATVGAPNGTLVGGTLAQTVESNASTALQNAASAVSAVGDKLSKSAGGPLSGNVTLSTGGALQVGTASWTSGAPSGTGVVMSPKGVAAVYAGTPTFYIDATNGDAMFGGRLSAATGTFSGNISGSSGTFSGSLTASQVITTDNLQDNGVSSVDIFSSGISSLIFNPSVFVVSRTSKVLVIAKFSADGSGFYVANMAGDTVYQQVSGNGGENAIAALSMEAGTYKLLTYAGSTSFAYVLKVMK